MNNQWVITAAHCVDGGTTANDLILRFGEHDLKSTDEHFPHIERRVESILIHPQYSDIGLVPKHDFALLKLAKPVEYAMHVIPICLPKDNNLLVNEIAWAKGFGDLSYRGSTPTVLQEMSAPIISNYECEKWTWSRIRNIPKIMMCVGNKQEKNNICQGDSGGPLVVKHDGFQIYEIHFSFLNI